MSATKRNVVWTTASKRPLELSKHFMLTEFTRSDTAARNGISNTPTPHALQKLFKLAELLEQVRELCGFNVVHISSGYRSEELNDIIKGSRSSQHMQGEAADFTIPRFGSPLDICKAIEASGIEFGQLIYEGTWVHISLGTKREVLTAKFAKGKKTTYVRGLPA